MNTLARFLRGKTRAEMVRYFIGGSSTALLCWSILLVLTEKCRINYLISANIAGFAAYFYSYIINKYFVFKNFQNTHVRHGVRFIVLQGGLWALANGLLYAGVEVAHIHYFVMIMVIAVISLVLNFTIMKVAIFSR
jgi:putative flippase GtrA